MPIRRAIASLVPLVVAITVIAAAWAGAVPGPGPQPPVADPLVSTALADVERSLQRYVEEWIRIAEIPAPPGGEQERAAYIEGRFRDLGLSSVEIDAAGNVVGYLEGEHDDRGKVALLAHMDTVAPAEADHTIERSPGRLTGPGVRDDSSGLAGLLAVADLITRHGLTPPAGIFFVATVREEIGLEGAERFVSDHAGELGAVIAVDGQLGQISHAATGILWLELHFTARGAHTLRAHDEPSAVLAAARAIERISAIPLRRSPQEMETWLNIGMIGGGDVPNAQARDVWFTVDLRANDPASFERLEREVLSIAAETAREVGVGFQAETLHRMQGGRIPGSERSDLVLAARRVLDRLSWNSVEVTMRGTADHNVAIRRGIPGIAIGMTTGGAAHTPEEYADIAPFATGIEQLLLLALTPVTR